MKRWKTENSEIKTCRRRKTYETRMDLFGKIQLAWLCLRQGQLENCRTVVTELEEMGLNSEELPKLRRALEEKPQKRFCSAMAVPIFEHYKYSSA